MLIMWNKFLSSFRDAARTFFRTLLLLLFCGAVAFLIVYPLWKFGTAAPRVYTGFVLAAAACCLLFFAAKKIRAVPWQRTARTVLIVLIVAAVAAAAAAAVLAGRRMLAIPAVLLAPTACVLVSAAFSRFPEQNGSAQ